MIAGNRLFPGPRFGLCLDDGPAMFAAKGSLDPIGGNPQLALAPWTPGLDQISHAMGEGGVAATTIRNDLCKKQPRWREPRQELGDAEDGT